MHSSLIDDHLFLESYCWDRYEHYSIIMLTNNLIYKFMSLTLFFIVLSIGIGYMLYDTFKKSREYSARPS